MPFTLNGIGTGYYGRKNELSRTAPCDRCGRESRLKSYDTWHFFCFVYIPVIPLGRKRVLDSCAFCDTHRVMSYTAWGKFRVDTLEQAMLRVKEEPANPDAQIALHQACVFFGEPEKADALQLRMREDFPNVARVHLYLAASLGDRGREAEAAEALRRAREIDPSIGVGEPPKPVKIGARRRPAALFALLALVACLFVGAPMVGSFYKRSNRTLHVVNGFDKPVIVEWDGGPGIAVDPHRRRVVTLAEGRYVARVSGAVAAEHLFEIDGSFFGRLFDRRTFVLNPGGEAVLVQDTATYSVAPGGGPIQTRLHYGKPFLALRADYAFEPLPLQIKTEQKSGAIKKTRIDYLRTGPEESVRNLLDESRHDEGLELAEWALKARPRPDSSLADFYASAAGNHGQAGRALSVLKPLLARRPVEIPVHRAYQNLSEGALAEEYDALLKEAPDDSARLYLRGRLERRVSKSRPYYERAIRADATNAWAHAALSRALSAVGDWEGARAAAEKASSLRPDSARFREFLQRTRMALKEYDTVARELTEASHQDFLNLSLHETLVRLLALAGRKEEVQTVGREYLDRLRGRRESDVQQAILRFRASFFYALGDFEALAGVGPQYRKVALLEMGKADEAEKEAGDPHFLVLLALAILRKDDAAALGRGAEALEKALPEFRAAAKALRTGAAADLEEALDVEGDLTTKAAVVVLLARRFQDRAAELKSLARRLNVLPVFPYHLVRRASE